MGEGLRNRLTTNHRGELGKELNRSQRQPDKTRFVAQVVSSNIKWSTKHCIRNSDEDSRSLVNVVYSSGEPLVTDQRMGRGEDMKKCHENSSKTYEDIRIFPSLANYQTVLPRPVAQSVMTGRLPVWDTRHTHHSTR